MTSSKLDDVNRPAPVSDDHKISKITDHMHPLDAWSAESRALIHQLDEEQQMGNEYDGKQEYADDDDEIMSSLDALFWKE